MKCSRRLIQSVLGPQPMMLENCRRGLVGGISGNVVQASVLSQTPTPLTNTHSLLGLRLQTVTDNLVFRKISLLFFKCPTT